MMTHKMTNLIVQTLKLFVRLFRKFVFVFNCPIRNTTSISLAFYRYHRGHQNLLWFYHLRTTRFHSHWPLFETCPARWPHRWCHRGTNRSARPLCNCSWIIWLGLDCRRNTFVPGLDWNPRCIQCIVAVLLGCIIKYVN